MSLVSTAVTCIPQYPMLKLLNPATFFSRPQVTKSFCNSLKCTKAIAEPEESTVPTSAYIHLPFCRKRCFYCDFPIVALGAGTLDSNNDHRMQKYTELICKEITQTAIFVDAKAPLDTIFFGGGTPSLMSASLLSRILECLSKRLGVAPEPEISIEMDPGTFDGQKLKEFISLGINRVSLGVQAFQDNLLKSCGRAHGLSEVYESIDTVRSSGLKNWSVDLISSLPHQSLKDWEQSLQQVIDSRPAHVSVYDLQIEEGTKFGLWYKPGKNPLPSEDCSAEFYKIASRRLRAAGYEHYEISNYAKPGSQCRHNLVYWRNLPYFGFGLGATSYLRGARFSRPRRLTQYAAFVENLENSGNAVFQRIDGTTKDEDKVLDTVMLSLRLSRGLDLSKFSKGFGGAVCLALCRNLEPFVRSGHVIPLDRDQKPVSSEVFDAFCCNGKPERFPNGRKRVNHVAFLRLSDPEGFLLSNELISTAFSAISEGFNQPES